jgi:chromosome segregation ATPase
MDATSQNGEKKKYTTSRRIQAWFLGRSRDNWKRKYKELKVRAKRLANRVNDVTRSRESWRERVEKLEAENAALREQAAPPKYSGGDSASRDFADRDSAGCDGAAVR